MTAAQFAASAEQRARATLGRVCGASAEAVGVARGASPEARRSLPPQPARTRSAVATEADRSMEGRCSQQLDAHVTCGSTVPGNARKRVADDAAVADRRRGERHGTGRSRAAPGGETSTSEAYPCRG